MKKKILCAVMAVSVAFGATGCESWERAKKDASSEWDGGLQRKITAYDYNGNVLYEYSGKVDIQMNESKVLFDTEDGKRVIIYNAIVVTEEE